MKSNVENVSEYTYPEMTDAKLMKFKGLPVSYSGLRGCCFDVCLISRLAFHLKRQRSARVHEWLVTNKEKAEKLDQDEA